MSKHPFKRTLASVSIAFFCFVLTTGAQVTTGTISGVVRDQSGAVIAGTNVVISNLEKGITRTVTTDGSGYYRAPQLSLGPYSVKVESGGFQTTEQTGLTLTVGAELVVNFNLAVKSAAQEVTVTAELPQVQTTSSTLSYLVNERTLQELPLNGRNYTQLAVLQPGVVLNVLAQHNVVIGTGITITVQGQRVASNLFLIDGTTVMDHGGKLPGGVLGTSLGVDAIREFNMLTGNYSAEYGTFMGGVVNVVTRSGTNQLHGDAFEFLRNSALDAKNFFILPGQSIPAYRRNQFGGALGGPIKKDRAFFFGNYEGLRESKGVTYVSTVPNQAARNGILPSGTVQVNSVILPLLNAYPLPNGKDNLDGTGQYISSPNQLGTENYVLGRTDFQPSRTNSLFTRYTYDASAINTPDALSDFFRHMVSRSQSVTISDTTLVSPSVVNVVNFGFSRSFLHHFTDDLRSFPYTFRPDVPTTKIGNWSILSPSIYAVGGGQATRNEEGRHYAFNIFEVNDKISVQRGVHAFSFGVSVKRYQYNMNLFNNDGVTFNTLQHFLQAQIDQVNARVVQDTDRGHRNTLFATFVQDDYRVLPNLTLNLGLRWEFSTSPTEAQGKVGRIPNPLTATSITPAESYFDTPKDNFAPRIGFAWDPFRDGKTSVRGGASIFYDIYTPSIFSIGGPAGLQPPYVKGVLLLATPAQPLKFPDYLNTPGLNLANQPQSATFFGNMNTPTRYFWTLGVQRQLERSTLLDITYSGSRATHLFYSAEANTTTPQVDANGQTFFPTGAPRLNPNFQGMTQYANGAGSFYHALTINLSRRVSHGLQWQLSYTFSKNINTSDSAWASSESLNGNNATDITNLGRDRGLSMLDARHALAANLIWDVPSPRVTGAAGKVLNGWQVNSIVTRTTGRPFTPVDGFRRSNRTPGASGFSYPNLIPGRDPNPVLGGPDKYFDPTAFALQPAGYEGNLGRNTVTGPGFANVDFALNKSTALTERVKIAFRAEFFNVLNHPNFGLPGLALFNTNGTLRPTAGLITSTVNDSRQIQFGLKFSF